MRGDGGGHVFINNNDDKGLPVALLPSMLPLALFFFFTAVLEGRDKDDSFMRELFSHHSGALDKIHNEPNDRNDYVGDHSDAWRNLTWLLHSAGKDSHHNTQYCKC